jgi:hypothetical protein
MNESEMRNLWNASELSLETIQQHTLNNAMNFNKLKYQSRIRSMTPIKLFTLLIGICWVGIWLSALIPMYANQIQLIQPFFVYSISIQVVITAVAILIYAFQWIKIQQIDWTQPLVHMQETLLQLESSTLWSARILFLQLPVWTTFWWNDTMLNTWSIFQWLPCLLITMLFTFVSSWLFSQLTIKNQNKWWFKLILNGKEWQPIQESLAYLKEFKEEKATE